MSLESKNKLKKGRVALLETKKKKKFKLFDFNKDKKDAVEEDRKPTLAFFFKSLFRKFPNLLRLNVLMLFQIIPIIVYVLVFFLGEKTPTITNVSFAPLFGISQSVNNPGISPILDLSSIQMGLPVLSPALIWTLIILGAIMAITWGWQNVGATYVLRGLVRGDAVFVFSDFFYGIKKNFKQGFLLGLIDFIICAILVIDLMFFGQQLESYGSYFMFFAITAIAIIYFMMRFYIYLLLITFDIKIFKLIKNAFLFSILGILRNMMASLGIAFLVIIHLLSLLLLFVGQSVQLIIPLLYFMPTTAFMAAYAAYPVIDKYMIAPYADEKSDEEEYIYFKSDDNEISENN